MPFLIPNDVMHTGQQAHTVWKKARGADLHFPALRKTFSVRVGPLCGAEVPSVLRIFVCLLFFKVCQNRLSLRFFLSKSEFNFFDVSEHFELCQQSEECLTTEIEDFCIF